jgi:hypothetical protein
MISPARVRRASDRARGVPLVPPILDAEIDADDEQRNERDRYDAEAADNGKPMAS